jgi:hypothetical protein
MAVGVGTAGERIGTLDGRAEEKGREQGEK